MSRARRSMWLVPVAVVAIGVLLVAVFPTRTFLAQQASVRAAEEKLGVLDQQNGHLEELVRLLNDDAEIEWRAREYYHLVRRGEQAYAVFPAAASSGPPRPVGTPPGPPVDDRTVLEKARDWVVDRF